MVLFSFGILSATRGAVVLPLLGLATLVFQARRTTITKLIKVVFFITLLSMIAFASIPQTEKEFVLDKSSYLVSRFEINEKLTGGRNTEAEDLFKTFTITEWIFGRGAGGSHEFGFWQLIGTPGNLGIPFTHFGFLNLLLKGGLPLLLIVYGVAVWAMFFLWQRGDRRYFFMILLYLVFELSHTRFNDPFFMILFWISISYSLQLKSTLKNSNQKSISKYERFN
jgi:hypothetical protein